MKFDFGLENLWAKKNQALQEQLKLNPLSTIRTYPGISHAVAEIVKGVVRLFPHRKSFAVIKGCGPFFEDIVEYLSQEGMARVELTVKDLTSPADCLQKIPKDCLFVLGSYDDPMTGQVFPIEALYDVLHKNRTFTITSSHNFHLVRGLPNVTSYMAVITKLRSGGALALLGQRASKIPGLVPGASDWFREDDWGNPYDSVVEKKKEVDEFEKRLPKEFVPFFSDGVSRLYDRAVICAPKFDGEACIQYLSRELKLKLGVPGKDTNFETLSLCRWNSMNTFNWYLDNSRSLADLRGVFMLDSSLANPATLAALQKVSEAFSCL